MLHYSESHLDTLGLCYFLALRRYEANLVPSFKLLILDDVMHSVDAAHRVRTAELIREQFTDHQIVVTTHDTLFYDAMRREFGGKFKYYKINNWSLERGPVLGNPLTDFDRIVVKEVRDTLGVDELASSGGRFFEWLLREIAEDVEIAVPFRSKRRLNIGVLWPAVQARLRKQRGYARVEILDRLDRNAWVRNECGAHYNEPEAAVTPQEAREFAEALSDFYHSLYCAECKMFLKRKGNDSWACDGGHMSYAK